MNNVRDGHVRDTYPFYRGFCVGLAKTTKSASRRSILRDAGLDGRTTAEQHYFDIISEHFETIGLSCHRNEKHVQTDDR